jgi:hypothetical protein
MTLASQAGRALLRASRQAKADGRGHGARILDTAATALRILGNPTGRMRRRRCPVVDLRAVPAERMPLARLGPGGDYVRDLLAVPESDAVIDATVDAVLRDLAQMDAGPKCEICGAGMYRLRHDYCCDGCGFKRPVEFTDEAQDAPASHR